MIFLLLAVVLAALVLIEKKRQHFVYWHRDSASYMTQIQALKVTREELQAMKAEGQ
jgi:hypothetical protein